MCVYLNTNGVVHSAFGFFVTCGVIHDEKGTWVLGYNRFLGKCSVAVAELWGILDGFVLRQKQEANHIADTLAKMALSSDEVLHMFEEPLLEIKEILKEENTLDNSFMNSPM
ncbi:hypothetical protein Golob_000731 [Gossypium lobatum]|uniref:RNase H type-1 domain-containing protein n=2 Tax=Gossypium TaxID=3633 RepID=A0A7J8N8W4_9ROSI|nr:hypothetical protein [Gossypium lobatum]